MRHVNLQIFCGNNHDYSKKEQGKVDYHEEISEKEKRNTNTRAGIGSIHRFLEPRKKVLPCIKIMTIASQHELERQAAVPWRQCCSPDCALALVTHHFVCATVHVSIVRLRCIDLSLSPLPISLEGRRKVFSCGVTSAALPKQALQE